MGGKAQKGKLHLLPLFWVIESYIVDHNFEKKMNPLLLFYILLTVFFSKINVTATTIYTKKNFQYIINFVSYMEYPKK